MPKISFTLLDQWSQRKAEPSRAWDQALQLMVEDWGDPQIPERANSWLAKLGWQVEHAGNFEFYLIKDGTKYAPMKASQIMNSMSTAIHDPSNFEKYKDDPFYVQDDGREEEILTPAESRAKFKPVQS
jgi:hypothetical protein